MLIDNHEKGENMNTLEIISTAVGSLMAGLALGVFIPRTGLLEKFKKKPQTPSTIETIFENDSDILKIIRDALLDNQMVSVESMMKPQEDTLEHVIRIAGKTVLHTMGNKGGMSNAMGRIRKIVFQHNPGADVSKELFAYVDLNLMGENNEMELPLHVEISMPPREDYLSSHIISIRRI